MLEIIVALIGIIVTTMVMIAGLITFRSWGDEQRVNPVYPDRSRPDPAAEPPSER